jgi:hypothetical protein
MQAAHRDINWNEATCNMLAEDLRIAAALAERGRDFRLVLGDGDTGLTVPRRSRVTPVLRGM